MKILPGLGSQDNIIFLSLQLFHFTDPDLFLRYPVLVHHLWSIWKHQLCLFMQLSTKIESALRVFHRKPSCSLPISIPLLILHSSQGCSIISDFMLERSVFQKPQDLLLQSGNKNKLCISAWRRTSHLAEQVIKSIS